ncbi:hypothetical protein [Burkholderia phage FLC9]|nr:hypothetical protein [Burkholderia phage FLC9]
MKLLKLAAIANNIEMLLGGFFDATYNEHRGPIQIVHQIERVRSNRFFEDDAFYQLIISDEFRPGGSFNPLDRALDVVDANTKVWRGTTIGRKVELASTARWNGLTVNLGDMVWAAYLHIQAGGDSDARALRVLDDALWQKTREDDSQFYHTSEYTVNTLEGKTIVSLATDAIQRLKAVS